MTAPRNRIFPLFVLILGIVLLAGFAVEAAPKAKPVPVDQYKEIAKTMTHSFAAGLGSSLANVKNDKERIDLVRSFIDPVRFFPDNSGYFYVYDSKCVNIAHATQKDLQGKNLYDYKDAKGKLVIQTYNPEHPVIKAIGEIATENFYENELEKRKSLKYPPFYQIIKLFSKIF